MRVLGGFTQVERDLLQFGRRGNQVFEVCKTSDIARDGAADDAAVVENHIQHVQVLCRVGIVRVHRLRQAAERREPIGQRAKNLLLVGELLQLRLRIVAAVQNRLFDLDFLRKTLQISQKSRVIKALVEIGQIPIRVHGG